MLFEKKPVPDYLKYFAVHVDEVGPDSKCVKSYWVYRGHSFKRIGVEVFGGVLKISQGLRGNFCAVASFPIKFQMFNVQLR